MRKSHVTPTTTELAADKGEQINHSNLTHLPHTGFGNFYFISFGKDL